jgi:hypothetical protein
VKARLTARVVGDKRHRHARRESAIGRDVAGSGGVRRAPRARPRPPWRCRLRR